MCHPILGSITTDLVELKLLVCILQGSNPFRPRPKCTVERTNLHEKKVCQQKYAWHKGPEKKGSYHQKGNHEAETFKEYEEVKGT